MESISDVFEAGMRLHQAGDLQRAEQCYRRVLEADPRHSQAMHALGLVSLQAGQNAAAIDWFKAAIAVEPVQPMFHAHLADAYRNLGQLDRAASHFRQAIAIAPDFAEAHEALGTVLRGLGDLEGAMSSYRESTRVRPGFAVAHYNLGVMLKALGRADDAAASYRAALAAEPTLAEAHFNLGALFHERRDFAAAATEYQKALGLRPDYITAIDNYALLVQVQGRLDEALEYFERALQLRPDRAMSHFNRANVYKMKDMRAEAIAGYRETLRLDPNYVKAYQNLAVSFNEVQLPDPALEYGRKGLALDPNSALLCGNVAFALHTQGRGEEAVAWYLKAIALAPERPELHGNLLYTLNYLPRYDPAEVFAEHRAWARRHAEPLTAKAEPHAAERTSDRRLRIGYVSAQFCQHAVNYFTEPLILAHDRGGFEVFCYSDVLAPDAETARLRAGVEHWRDAVGKSDDELARMVRDDRIDILVDLAGHIGGNRLLVFARKPAPVQLTYLGYQNTTGMSAMDYRLTDERADPPGLTEAFYTEQLVRLPRTFFCYRPPDDAPPVTRLPAIDLGRVTYGAFNAYRKTTPEAIAAWLEILRGVPRSRLLVLASRGGYVERRLHEMAAAALVEPERVQLCDRRGVADYLQLIGQADIALDPFPFTGHTTTCDAAWMGVPVVMLQGRTYASRFGGSVLANLDLENLIADSVGEYVATAVALAGDLDRLSQLRSALRPRFAASPLMDFAGFAGNVEAAYRQMWQSYLAK